MNKPYKSVEQKRRIDKEYQFNYYGKPRVVDMIIKYRLCSPFSETAGRVLDKNKIKELVEAWLIT